MTSVDLSSVVQFEDIRKFCIVSSAALLIYDYFLTLEKEIRYVWPSRWTPGKVLFCLVRYLYVVEVSVYLWDYFASKVTQQSCAIMNQYPVFSGIFGSLAAYLVVGLRTWAIWNRSRFCGVLIVVAYTSVVITTSYYGILSIRGTSALPNNIPGLKGCMATESADVPGTVVKLYINFAVYETVIYIMTLVQGVRNMRKPSTLTFVLYRDAFMASTILFASAIVNSAVSGMSSPYVAIPYVLNRVLMAILPGRIILNIREATMNLDGWDVMNAQPRSSSGMNRTDMQESVRAEGGGVWAGEDVSSSG